MSPWHSLFSGTCFQCAWHAHTPRAHPVLLFSPGVRPLCVSSALPPAPELPWGTFSLAPPVPQCLDKRRPQRGCACLFLDAPPTGPDGLASSCLAHFARMLFACGSLIPPAVLVCTCTCAGLTHSAALGIVGSSQTGSCRRAGKNGRCLVLGFRSLNRLLRQRVASGLGARGGWRAVEVPLRGALCFIS